MSFSGTPLGQGRRLDHNTFLGKPPSTTNRPPSPHHLIPTSYAYGAPTLDSWSPPKPTSPIREKTNTNIDREVDQNEPALARYARFKQRDQASLASRPGGPKIITSPPHPEKWSVKDTSVNIATAFHQAVTEMHPTSNPNNSWASGSNPNPNVPRSTSVEYEKETQSTISRRLAPPPNRLRGTTTRKPPSKTTSVRHVPDSEGEEERVDQNGRGRSPLEAVIDITKRALEPATFYLRQRSQEPQERSTEQHPTNGKDSSYDYSAEEREFQAAQNQSHSRRVSHATHRKGRMSTDNKAYKPSASDLDVSDEDFSDDGKTRRRRKKKKEPVGGPLTTLPMVGADKRKKKKARGSRGNAEGLQSEESDEDHASDRQSAQQRASAPRGSAPPLSRVSIPRGSIPPETHENTEQSFDVEQGLDTIAEGDEGQLDQQGHYQPHFSIGGFLGKIVRLVYLALLYSLQFISMLLFVLGKVIGTIFDVMLNRPIRWIASTGTGPVVTLGRYLILAFIISAAWYTLQDPLLKYTPHFPSSPSYHAPEVPAANIAELSARLQRIENVLSGLSLDNERSRTKAENDARSHLELAGRLGALESRVQRESVRAADVESQSRKLMSQGLQAVRQEVELLHAQIEVQAQQGSGNSEAGGKDEEARINLKALEERVGSVEGEVREALDLGKKAGSGGTGAAWWNKLASGSASKAGLTIKSTDGQDVTSLIGQLVDSAVSTYHRDTLSRPDFALHSAGARIIPSLTSGTFEIQPSTLRGQLVGLVTGNGNAIGRPPVTALHHELHVGHCWPFAGSKGQLGVMLAAPAYISDVSIDHVAKEVAFDLRSAPREMEVWGLVEGRDNIAKVKEWKTEKAQKKEERKREAEKRGEAIPADEAEEVYPKTLPKSPRYIRIASFKYNIYAPNNVQTFPVSQEIQDLGVDFGIVVLMIKNNWGREEVTCLYRFRIHGERIGETSLPYPEEPLGLS